MIESPSHFLWVLPVFLLEGARRLKQKLEDVSWQMANGSKSNLQLTGWFVSDTTFQLFPYNLGHLSEKMDSHLLTNLKFLFVN